LTAGIKANADGSAAIQVGGSDAITITSGLNTTFAGTAAVPTGMLYPIVSGTAVTASGTSVDFTSIPSWVKRITVMWSGVSTNGTSNPLIQLGDSGGIETTGYLANSSDYTASGAYTTGFGVYSGQAANILHGVATFALLNASTNIWSCFGVINNSNGNYVSSMAGSKSLSATLDRVRITTVNGTDTFDAGSFNILYE
jgi:hypothetical protein